MITIKPLASSSRGNAHLLSAGGAPVLLEAGLPFKELRRRIWDAGYGTADLAGCLISHEHGDHARAALDLAAHGVDIYTSRGTAGAIARQEQHMIRPIKGEPETIMQALPPEYIMHHRVQTITARQEIGIGEWTVLPFETVHDAEEPLGFLIGHRQSREKVVYITDTPYIPVRFKGLTAIMIECNYAGDILEHNTRQHPEVKRRVIKNHFGLDQVKDFLRVNDLKWVREIWLIHLSEGSSDAARFKQEIQELTGRPVYIADE